MNGEENKRCKNQVYQQIIPKQQKEIQMVLNIKTKVHGVDTIPIILFVQFGCDKH